MSGFRLIGALAAAGSTGNNTHASVPLDRDLDADALALEFKITAVGATPTITFKFQGSLDDPGVSDANSDWFDVSVDPEDGTASAVSFVKTAVAVLQYALQLQAKPLRKIRLVTSANTNVTYQADAYAVDRD